MVKKRCKFELRCGSSCNVCEECGSEKFVINTDCGSCISCLKSMCGASS